VKEFESFFNETLQYKTVGAKIEYIQMWCLH